MQMNISARKIEQPFYCHVTYRYRYLICIFDRLACNYGVYHPYFSLKVRGEATEGTQREPRRAMDGVGNAAAHSAAPVPVSCLVGHAAGRWSGHRFALHVQPRRGCEATTTFDYRCLRLLFLDEASMCFHGALCLALCPPCVLAHVEACRGTYRGHTVNAGGSQLLDNMR